MASTFLENILTPYLKVCGTDSGILHECRTGQALAGCDRDLREERSLPEDAGTEENYEKCESGYGTSPQDSNGAPPNTSLKLYVCNLHSVMAQGDHRKKIVDFTQFYPKKNITILALLRGQTVL